MTSSPLTPLRVAAINFLNPAPLMRDFEHPPLAAELAQRYTLHYTLPSRCADELLAARADLGLIPIASLTPELAIVPGCTIASLDEVRSIQLIVKSPHTLATVRTIAADTASRSSLAYAEILFRKFLHTHPTFLPAAPRRRRHPHRPPPPPRPRIPRTNRSHHRTMPMDRRRPPVAHPHQPPL